MRCTPRPGPEPDKRNRLWVSARIKSPPRPKLPRLIYYLGCRRGELEKGVLQCNLYHDLLWSCSVDYSIYVPFLPLLLRCRCPSNCSPCCCAAVLCCYIISLYHAIHEERWRGSLAELMLKADRMGNLREILDLPSEGEGESVTSEGAARQTSAVSCYFPVFFFCVYVDFYRIAHNHAVRPFVL